MHAHSKELEFVKRLAASADNVEAYVAAARAAVKIAQKTASSHRAKQGEEVRTFLAVPWSP